jgi:iron complex outermembrane receptor protein
MCIVNKNIFAAMIHLCFLVLILSCPISTIHAAGDPFGKIEGCVVRKDKGTPVVNVNVSIQDLTTGTITDGEGRFRIENIPPGSYTVDFSHVGYEKQSIHNVVIESGTATPLAVVLKERIIRSPEEFIVEGRRDEYMHVAEIDMGEIETKQAADVGTLLRGEGGMNSIRKGGSFLDPSLRGFTGERISVLIDGGTRVCGACPNRMDPPSAHVQAEDLEKLEILRGPSVLRFGPNFGGIINLVMTRPPRYREMQIHGSLRCGYDANADGRKGRLSLYGGNRSMDFYVSGGTKDVGNYTDGKGEEVPSFFRANDYSLKAGYNFTTDHRLQFTYRGSHSRDTLYPALPMDLDIDDTQILALDYGTGDPLPWLSRVTVKAYRSMVDHEMSNRRKPTFNTVHAVTTVDASTWGGYLHSTWKPFYGIAIETGGDFSRILMDGDRRRAPVDTVSGEEKFVMYDAVWPGASHENIGAYLELSRLFEERLLMKFALRGDFSRLDATDADTAFTDEYGVDLQRTYSMRSASAGVEYSLYSGMAIEVSLGRGERAPGIAEHYIYLFPIGMDPYDYLGNPGLSSEKNLELNLGFSFRSAPLEFSLSAFYGKITDYISARRDTSVTPKHASMGILGVRRFTNIDHALRKGFEFESTLRLPMNFSIEGTVSQVIGKDETLDAPLPEMPPLESTAALFYIRHPYRVELRGRFVASQRRVSKEYGEEETPGFHTFGFRTSSTLSRGVNLTFGIENIFDVLYYEHLNRNAKVSGERIPEPGRRVFLGFDYTF